MSAEDWRTIGECATALADAIDDNDPILGILSSRALITNIASLPKELREEIADACTDPERILSEYGP